MSRIYPNEVAKCEFYHSYSWVAIVLTEKFSSVEDFKKRFNQAIKPLGFKLYNAIAIEGGDAVDYGDIREFDLGPNKNIIGESNHYLLANAPLNKRLYIIVEPIK